MKVTPNSYQGVNLGQIIERVIGTGGLGSIATVTPTGEPHIHTVYYVATTLGKLVFVSNPGSSHAANAEDNSRCAIAIHPPGQCWDDWKVGIQGFGSVVKLENRERDAALAAYRREYPEYGRWVEQEAADLQCVESEVFEITLRRIQILAEEELGEENLVTVEVR